jgi:hypothetical protein
LTAPERGTTLGNRIMTKQCPKCRKDKDFEPSTWKQISLYGMVCGVCAGSVVPPPPPLVVPLVPIPVPVIRAPLDVTCPNEAPRLGGETEIAGTLLKVMRYESAAWKRADIDYDDTIAVTHPKYRQLGVVELMHLACDQVDKVEDNAALIEYKSGAIAATSRAVWSGIKRAEKQLWAALSGVARLPNEGPLGHIKWTTVLTRYNAKLAQAGDLLPFKLYTVPELLAVLEEERLNATVGSPAHRLATQWRDEWQGMNPVPDHYEWYYKKIVPKSEAGTAQANFELDLEAIGSVDMTGKGMEAAFHNQTHIKLFKAARGVARNFVDTRLGTLMASQQRRLVSVITIFGYTCMVGLTRGYFPQKDSFDLIFKSAPDDIVRLSISSPAQRSLAALMRGATLARDGVLPNKKTGAKGTKPLIDTAPAALTALATELLTAYRRTGAVLSDSSASWHLAWLTYWVFDVFTPSLGGRYGGETSQHYGDRISDASLSPFSWTGKPLVPRMAGSRIFVVAEARREKHPFSRLVQLRQNPMLTTSTEATELRRLQALRGT